MITPAKEYRKTNPAISFSDIVKGNSQNRNEQNEENLNDFKTLINELKEINSICNLKTMIELTKKLKIKLQSATSSIEKLMIFNEIANELDNE